MKKVFLSLVIIFVLSLLSTSFVLATEADSTQDELAASLDEVQALTTDELESLDGVEITEPIEIPGTFGLWWRSVKENVSLALTFDQTKKTEKQLRFAEERVKLANFIVETSEDPEAQEKAVAIVVRANKFMEKVQARSGDFLAKINERTEKLLANVARHELNKEKVLDKLEDKVSLEKLPELQKVKATIAEKTGAFLEKIMENENIPEEVKAKITIRKEAIIVRQEARIELREDYKELLEKALTGDKEAKVEFESKREENQIERQEIIKEFKNQTQSLINKAREGAPGVQRIISELGQIKIQAEKVIRNQAATIKIRTENQQRIMDTPPVNQGASGRTIQVPDPGEGPSEPEPVEPTTAIEDGELEKVIE